MKNNVITKRVHRLFSMLMLCLMIFSSTGSGAYAAPSEMSDFPSIATPQAILIMVTKNGEPYPNASLILSKFSNDTDAPTIIKNDIKTDSMGMCTLYASMAPPFGPGPLYQSFDPDSRYEIRIKESKTLSFDYDHVFFYTDPSGKVFAIESDNPEFSMGMIVFQGSDKNTGGLEIKEVQFKVIDKDRKPVEGVPLTANIISPLASYQTKESDKDGVVKFELEARGTYNSEKPNMMDSKIYSITVSKNGQFMWEFKPEEITLYVFKNKVLSKDNLPLELTVTKNDRTHLLDDLKKLLQETKQYIESNEFTNEQALNKLKQVIAVVETELSNETIPGYAESLIDGLKKYTAELKKYEKPKSVPNSSSVGSTSRASVRPDTTTTIKNNDTPLAQQPTETQNAASINENTVAVLKINSLAYQVQENGKLVEKKSEVSPMIHQNRTMLPSRFIADLLGVGVEFDNASKTAKFLFESETNGKKEQNIAELTLGKNTMKFNGKEVPLSAEILNVNGRILLPMSDIQKAFKELGLNVDIKWNHETKTLFLEKIK